MINKDENNTYRWIYEQPMLKSFFLLYEVWRVLLLAAVKMDENGIDHTQIKTDAAKALDALTVFTGMAARQRTTTAAGLLSASGGSLHSDFSKVKKIRCIRENNTILLSSTFIRNQVYAEDEDFDFVSGFIIDHCPNARTVD